MLSQEILRLTVAVLKSPETRIILFIFAFSRLSRGQPRYTKRGTLPEILKSGGRVPGSYVHDSIPLVAEILDNV